MRLKSFVRLVVVALIITTFYLAVIRDRSRHSDFDHHEPNTEKAESPTRQRSDWPRGRQKTASHSRRVKQSLEENNGLSCSSAYFSSWTEPMATSCRILLKDGYPLPDPRCTPGGINPSVSLDRLRDPHWRTRSVRNCENSEAQKHIAYRWYDIQKPRINSNQNQVCELDHLVPLELGGADGLGNIWPQCGPDAMTLNERYFKQKDHVENYLAEEVKSGHMPLGLAQRGIASDWTQYLPAATRWCQEAGRC